MPVIDFHAHILPCADHGSDGVSTSLAQLALMHRNGTDMVVATPHFYPDRDSLERFLRRRSRTAEQLREAVHLFAPTVYVGAEVAVCPYLEKMGREGLSELAIGGTDVILLEMPAGKWRSSLLEAVYGIRTLGFRVVLAHIDRYPLQNVELLLRDGFLAQVNAGALTRMFGKKRYIELIRSGAVAALGSDLHGAAEKNYRAFAGLRRKMPFVDGVFVRTADLLRGATPLYRAPMFAHSP